MIVAINAQLLERRRKGRTDPGVPGPPKITVDNALSDAATVVEIKCPDRVGLLYLMFMAGIEIDLHDQVRAARVGDEPVYLSAPRSERAPRIHEDLLALSGPLARDHGNPIVSITRTRELEKPIKWPL